MSHPDLGIQESPADSLQKQEEQETGRDGRGRFQPGVSGNPLGRPAARLADRATVLAHAMLEGEVETLMRTVIDKALYRNDPLALRLCVERILVPRRLEHVEFEMPPLATSEDAVKALAAIAAAVAQGDLAPAEARPLAALVESFVRSLEAHDFEARLRTLENAGGGERGPYG